jgi:apolipoprotein N-acyltransferase
VFPEPSAGFARAGVDLLVNLTSDRDLGTGAAQHVAFSRFRAIEARRWLVRASGLGETLAIDPLGEVHAGSAFTIPRREAPIGLAARAPRLVPAASALLLALGLATCALRGRRSAPRTR